MNDSNSDCIICCIEDTEESNCIICWDRIENEVSKYKDFFRCKHYQNIHNNCTKQYLQYDRKENCPICREIFWKNIKLNNRITISQYLKLCCNDEIIICGMFIVCLLICLILTLNDTSNIDDGIAFIEVVFFFGAFLGVLLYLLVDKFITLKSKMQELNIYEI